SDLPQRRRTGPGRAHRGHRFRSQIRPARTGLQGRGVRRHRGDQGRHAGRGDGARRLRHHPHPGDGFLDPDGAAHPDEAAGLMADGGTPPAFLGVSRSLSGRVWRQRPAEAALIRAHMQALNLEEPLARALAARGVRADQGADFLAPTLKALFPDPSSFMDMDAAAEAILDALQTGASIHVFADYDVDGASSAALLVRWFRAMGAELPIYVPDRITEGYGPSPKAFDTLKARGAELVITVDCGAAANEAVAHAAAIGLKVVVIDHHMMREQPPVCAAVVNPNRPGCNSGQGNLAAAGVVFVLLAALNREGRRRGMFGEIKEPDIRQWLDLAAMGAICDVTGLTGF